MVLRTNRFTSGKSRNDPGGAQSAGLQVNDQTENRVGRPREDRAPCCLGGLAFCFSCWAQRSNFFDEMPERSIKWACYIRGQETTKARQSEESAFLMAIKEERPESIFCGSGIHL
jgi:hypothetical protein